MGADKACSASNQNPLPAVIKSCHFG
jgi:hypothetical protein